MTTVNARCGQKVHFISLFAVMATLLVSALPVMAQQAATTSGGPTPWTHQNYLDDADQFQFAVVSDRAANPREGVFKAAMAKLQLLRPTFVLSVGDFIHGYGEGMVPLTDEALVHEKRQKVDDMLKTLPMPFFRVTGNHDFNNDVSAAIWKELYGPNYYSFVYKDVLFMCLNSQDAQSKYGNGMGADQIAWAKETLAKHSDARWVCLFFHKPLWLEDEKRLERAKTQDGATKLTGFNEIEKLLDGRSYTVFAGHHHRYGKWVKNGNKYFRLATTGGASALGGPEAGQFDHIMWITMTDKGPIVCNIQLGGILDEDAKVNLPE